MKTILLTLFILIFPSLATAQTHRHIKIEQTSAENFTDTQKENLNTQCEAVCGSGYFYDRPGAKNNGHEIVCTKYLLKCGYSCTVGWNIRYLVGGTDFTCQEAKQKLP